MFQQIHNNITTSELDQMLHMLTSSNSIPMPFQTTSMDKKWKPNIEIAPNCPRCASTHTKFCYYNNYSLSQPRYFCKGCRRYWTKGGSLRNVPVGGGCRKTRRGKAVRNSQNSDRFSANGSGDDGDGNHQQNQNNGSRDIDMAVVFAKFLNQNPNSTTTTTTATNTTHHGDEELEIENDPNNNNGLSSSSNNVNNLSTTPDSVETENDAVVQSQNPFDQELSLSGIEYDQFEGLLGVDEDVVQDALWSESDAMNMMVSSSNNYTWQQPSTMMQMELEYSMSLNEDSGINHDQLLPINVNSNSTNVNLISDQSWISNSWDSFDLSTMEVFSSSSRP